MSSITDPRKRFAADSLATVSGPRVVVMCFDRLERDLTSAGEALTAGDLFQVNATLTHAQELLHELAAMLDFEVWEHATTLASIYEYVIRVLTVANTTKKMSKIEEAQRLLRQLGGAFREAAATTSAVAAPTAPGHGRAAAFGTDSPGSAGGFSAQA